MYVLLVMKGWRSYEVQHWWVPAGQLETDNIIIIVIVVVFIIIIIVVIIFLVIIVVLLIISWLLSSIYNFHHPCHHDHHHYHWHHHCQIFISMLIIIVVLIIISHFHCRAYLSVRPKQSPIVSSYIFTTQVSFKRALPKVILNFLLFLHLFLFPCDTWRPKVYILKILFEDIEQGEGTYWTSFSQALPLFCIHLCICITYELYLYHISKDFPFSCTLLAYLYCI